MGSHGLRSATRVPIAFLVISAFERFVARPDPGTLLPHRNKDFRLLPRRVVEHCEAMSRSSLLPQWQLL